MKIFRKKFLYTGVFLIALFLLECCSSTETAASADVPSDLVLDPDILSGTLSNGLEYFIKGNTEPSNRASLRLIVKAGSALEDDDQRGIAHLVEHMAFNGTENYQKHEIIDYLESIGMEFGPEINAYTSFNETVYMLEIPTEEPAIISNAFDILEEWAHRIAFDPEEIEKERGVVREEWRIGRGAQGRIMDQLFPFLFEGSVYAERLPIGVMDVVMNTPHQRIIDFYKDWYRPDLMGVIAVGDFDTAEVERLIKERFSFTGPDSKKPRPEFSIPPHDNIRVSIISDPEWPYSQIELVIKSDAAPFVSEFDYRRYLEEALFWNMYNDRLDELSRTPDSPILYAGGSRNRIVQDETFASFITICEQELIPDALEAVLLELRRIDEFGFTAGELERTKSDYLKFIEGIYLDRENINSASFADELLQYFLHGLPVPGIEFENDFYHKVIPEISLDSINKFAADIITRDNRMLSVITTEVGEVPEEEELLEVFNTVEKMKIDSFIDNVIEVPLLSEIPQPGSIVSEEYLEDIDAYILDLSNGIRVIYKSTDFKEDSILFRAFSPGGNSLAADTDYYSAAVSTSILNESGLGDFNAVQLEKALSGIDAAVNPYIDEFYEGLSGHASPADIETLFQMIYLNFTLPVFSEDAFSVFYRKLEAFVQNRELDPGVHYQDAVNSAMTSGHFRGQPLTSDTISLIDLDKAEKIYKDRFGDAGDFTFVFAGNIDGDTIRSLAETYLASLPSNGRIEKGLDHGIRPLDGIADIVVSKGLEPKSRVVIIFNGETDITLESDVLIKSTASILQTRLRELIREDLSGTYSIGVSAYTRLLPVPSYTSYISFGCDPERVEELTSEIFSEISRFSSSVSDALYLQKEKEGYRLSYETGIETNGFWISRIHNALRDGEDPEDLLTPEEYEIILDPESVMETAAAIFDPDGFIRVVLLPQNEGGQ